MYLQNFLSLPAELERNVRGAHINRKGRNSSVANSTETIPPLHPPAAGLQGVATVVPPPPMPLPNGQQHGTHDNEVLFCVHFLLLPAISSVEKVIPSSTCDASRAWKADPSGDCKCLAWSLYPIYTRLKHNAIASVHTVTVMPRSL